MGIVGGCLAAGPVDLSCAQDIGCLSPAFFEDFGVFQSTYNHDDLEMSRKMLHNTYSVCVEPHLVAALTECPAPTIELMLNVVLAVEAELGTDFAKDLFLRISKIIEKKEISDRKVGATKARLSRTAVATYEFLWGLLPGVAVTLPAAGPQHGRLPDRLKIFVYKYPAELAERLIYAPVGCSLGQWGTEVLLHRWLLSSGFVTDKAEEADLFYVPVYATCTIVRRNLSWKETGKFIYEPLFEFLQSQPAWKRNGGKDHVFLFADGQGVNQWPWYAAVQSSILLMVEGTCPTWGTPLEEKLDVQSCYSPWKDIIIPGHTDFARVVKLMELRKPLEERTLLFSWRGRSRFIHEAYNKSATRTAIVEHFLDMPHTDVGGFSKTFFNSKTNSQFCLVPSGTSPWSNHLYESLIAGCIPVILSDEYQLPFWHRLDWTQFSLKLPEGRIGPELFDHLADLPQSLILSLFGRVAENACWFNWWSDKTDCNPYLGIIEQLAERAQRLKQVAKPQFWNYPENDAVHNITRKSRFHSERDSYLWLD